MSGCYCNGSTVYQTYTGSQWHRAPLWTDDPLQGNIDVFMNPNVPSGFTPFDVPFLGAVTQLTGVGFNSLAAVPTANFPLPYAVDTLIGGQPQRWFLVAGTYSAGPGEVQPNDYNASSNARYWVQGT